MKVICGSPGTRGGGSAGITWDTRGGWRGSPGTPVLACGKTYCLILFQIAAAGHPGPVLSGRRLPRTGESSLISALKDEDYL